MLRLNFYSVFTVIFSFCFCMNIILNFVNILRNNSIVQFIYEAEDSGKIILNTRILSIHAKNC